MLDKTGHKCKHCQESEPQVSFGEQTKVVNNVEYSYIRKLCNKCKYKQYKVNKKKKVKPDTSVRDRIAQYFKEQ